MKPVEKNYYETAIAEADEKDDFENADILKTGYIEELKGQLAVLEESKGVTVHKYIEGETKVGVAFSRSYWYGFGAGMGAKSVGVALLFSIEVGFLLALSLFIISLIYLTVKEKYELY